MWSDDYLRINLSLLKISDWQYFQIILAAKSSLLSVVYLQTNATRYIVTSSFVGYYFWNRTKPITHQYGYGCNYPVIFKRMILNCYAMCSNLVIRGGKWLIKLPLGITQYLAVCLELCPFAQPSLISMYYILYVKCQFPTWITTDNLLIFPGIITYSEYLFLVTILTSKFILNRQVM